MTRKTTCYIKNFGVKALKIIVELPAMILKATSNYTGDTKESALRRHRKRTGTFEG
mgnify:CR=1 FL=1